MFMGSYVEDLWPRFFQVFNDSNQKYRINFFSEPIVHFLWGKFIVDKPHIVSEHIMMAGKNSNSEAMA